MADSPSFEEQVSEDDRKSLIRRLLESGSNAPKVMLQAATERNGQWAAKYVDSAMRSPSADDHDIDALVRRVIRSHQMLARSEGASVAAALTAAEVTSVVGTAGTLTPASAATGLISDLAGLAWIQVRMVLVIAALHGHDPRDPARYREMAALMGVWGAPQADRFAKAGGEAAERWLRRLILRHLRGENLRAIKSMFDLVGIKFTRTGVLKVLPGINVPISAFVNGQATGRLGEKAHTFYATLPPSLAD